MAETQQFRSIRGVLLDASIPVVRTGVNALASIEKALTKNEDNGSWSHKQVAVPKDKLDLKTLGFEKTHFSIPLPGESWGTPSYRHGELHAHAAGPFLLVHRDESAPGSGLLAHLVKDVPEALRKRFSGKIAPFVQEKQMSKRELHKTAMIAFTTEFVKLADSTFTTSQYAGPMGSGPFQQASQLPGFKAPGLKTAIEKPQQKIAEESGLATYGKHMALNAGQAVRDTKGIFTHPAARDVAPEGGLKRTLSSIAMTVPDIASDLYFGAVPPQLTHTKDELKDLHSQSAGSLFRIGLGKKAAALTPAGRLVATQRKGTGMGATTTGPSIAEVAKPLRMGHAMPGALKNRI